MKLLPVKEPISAGIILSYRCTNECRHCMYACSPTWADQWIDLADLSAILKALAKIFRRKYGRVKKGVLGLNYGLHLTGGEPFLNFPHLLKAVEIASRLEIPGLFVETNCFWCTDDEKTLDLLTRLKQAGLEGILISANPFVVERIPFERIRRCLRISHEVFGPENVMVYHPIFLRHLEALGVRGTLRFEEYIDRVRSIDPLGLMMAFSPSILLPMGRLPYTIGSMYRRYPAKRFFHESCLEELTRPWHIHIDCYCNYVPGYCAGLSLGDARKIDDIVSGVDLEDRPILRFLASSLKDLYDFAVKEFGYRENPQGYISKCHLCVDIRRHISLQTDEFKELRPREFYYHLELGGSQ